jgi:hypothetical protein
MYLNKTENRTPVLPEPVNVCFRLRKHDVQRGRTSGQRFADVGRTHDERTWKFCSASRKWMLPKIKSIFFNFYLFYTEYGKVELVDSWKLSTPFIFSIVFVKVS